MHLNLSRTTIFSLFQLQEFVDDNLKFDENGGKFSERVQNTVGKVDIARYEQFLLFPRCFQKTCTADTQKPRACLGNGKLHIIPLWKIH